MSWAIRFIPNETRGITVNINREFFMTWNSSMGDVTCKLPPKWSELSKIHVQAISIEEDKNASMQVLWNGENRKTMDFDDEEDHDVDKP